MQKQKQSEYPSEKISTPKVQHLFFHVMSVSYQGTCRPTAEVR